MKSKERKNPTSEELMNWINELRSGKWRQTKEALQKSNAYCCLGVACKITIPTEDIEKNGSTMTGLNPEDQSKSPFWLKRINEKMENSLGVTLVDLNDCYGYKFNEIADVIQLYGYKTGIL